ncbi:Protein CBG26827 [Caenorhabditis briggsae]|uniref:Protein CBG26827 n=1 Tax=Caenorhabditis briggsae TaxID=6238 RepID=B6IKD6_CAEBR|nr:Protein CBG26827 [Caenorhabditis briggsae]CAS00366.1 Protein CBG26827 [Caenorhabditis briggsae]
MRYSRLASSHEEADEYSRLLPMPDSEIGIEGSDDVYLLPSVSSTSSSTFSMTRYVDLGSYSSPPSEQIHMVQKHGLKANFH